MDTEFAGPFARQAEAAAAASRMDKHVQSRVNRPPSMRRPSDVARKRVPFAQNKSVANPLAGKGVK